MGHDIMELEVGLLKLRLGFKGARVGGNEPDVAVSLVFCWNQGSGPRFYLLGLIWSHRNGNLLLINRVWSHGTKCWSPQTTSWSFDPVLFLFVKWLSEFSSKVPSDTR